MADHDLEADRGDTAAEAPLVEPPGEPAEPGGDAPATPLGGPAPPMFGRRVLPTWLRRVGIGLALVLALGILYQGSKRNVVGTPEKERDRTVVSQIPAPGEKALRQTQVGAELRPGFDGRLTINGIPIPEAEMEGAVDPSTLTAELLEQYGVRPNGHSRVFFTPGTGKVIEEFESGPVTIVLTYFKDRQAADSGRTISWTVNVD